MALCLAESLVECGGFDAADQMRRYVRWYREGYMSASDRCFDISNTTRAALERFEATGDPWCGSSDPFTGGNGSNHAPRARRARVRDVAHLDQIALGAEQARDAAAPRRGHLYHRLVSLDGDERLIDNDVIAFIDMPGNDLGLFEALAKIG